MDLKNYSNADGRCVQGGASMLFSKDEKKVGEPKRRSWFGVMFAPDFGRDVRPVGENLGMFVRLLADIFVSARLFPKDHPSLKANDVRLTLFDVILTAWKALVFKRENLFQVVLFFSVIAGLLIAGIGALILLFSLISTPSHAAESNMFVPADKDNDWGLNWLNYLFMGKVITFTNGLDASGIASECGWRKAIGVALAYYSSGVLVLAGVLLLYHMLAMIAETAYHGTPMGKQANQIWAPIRLVVAIGLLVPISSSGSSNECAMNGLNTGQYIVIQVAKWGSGLASNIWQTFIDSLPSSTAGTECSSQKYNIDGSVDNSSVTTTPSPSCVHVSPAVRTLAFNIIISVACKEIYNNELAAYNGAGEKVSFSSSTHFYSNNEIGGDKICGGYVPVDTTKIKAPYLALYNIHQKDIENFRLSMENTVASLVNQVTPHTTTSDAASSLPKSDSLYKAVKELQEKMDSDAQNTLKTIDQIIATERKSPNSVFGKGGWLTAGAMFNDIARQEAQRYDAVTGTVPQYVIPTIYAQAYSDDKQKVADALTGRMDLEFGGLDQEVSEINKVGSLSRSAEARLERFNAWLYGGQSADQLKTVNQNGAKPSGDGELKVADAPFAIIERIATNIGLWSDVGVLGIKFDAARNPFAQVVSFGHKMLSAGLGMIAVGTVGNIFGSIPLLGSIASAATGAVSSILISVGIIFVGLGITLGYWLPLSPFIRFFFASMTWIIGVFEAVVAMPLFALAHLTPSGDGLSGPNAKRGYYLVLNNLLVPPLMVLGLMAGYILFSLSLGFLNTMFIYVAKGAASVDVAGTLPALSRIVFVCAYCALVYGLANNSFKTIGMFSQNGLTWLGGGGPAHREAMGDHKLISGAVGYIGGAAVMGQMQALAKAPGDAAKNIAANKKADKDAATATEAADNRNNAVIDAINGNKKQMASSTNPEAKEVEAEAGGVKALADASKEQEAAPPVGAPDDPDKADAGKTKEQQDTRQAHQDAMSGVKRPQSDTSSNSTQKGTHGKPA